MSEHEPEKLLGGFSADTLTPEERETLFRAALHDQELFNALADEQALKELLADSAVRQRLLRALAPRRDGRRWRSWLERFTSPSGLAWAGGVAVGVFAVVLGLIVHEAGLRQASETSALREAGPKAPATAPPVTPPLRAPLEEKQQQESKAGPRPEPSAKDTPSSSLKSPEQAAASRSRQEPEQPKKQKAPQQQGSTKEHAPIAALDKSREQPASSSDLRQAPSAPATEPEVRTMAQGETVPAAASARTLFYAQAPSPKIAATSQETESVQKTDQLALARKAPERAASAKPLAVRYSLVSDEPEPQANVAAHVPSTVTLAVESNQDGYVQIWKRTGDSLPELVLPAKETGRISLKTAARERHQLTVPGETDLLIVRLSRVPFGPITRQEAVMAGRRSPTQLTESASGAEELATYVANPDVSAPELAIEIPIGPRAR